MRNWLVRHPFLVIGIVTLGLFLAVEALREHGATVAARQLSVPLRILIIPMYLVWVLLTVLYVAIFGPEPAATALRFAWAAVQLTAGLLPYLAADYLWARARQRSKDPRRLVT